MPPNLSRLQSILTLFSKCPNAVEAVDCILRDTQGVGLGSISLDKLAEVVVTILDRLVASEISLHSFADVDDLSLEAFELLQGLIDMGVSPSVQKAPPKLTVNPFRVHYPLTDRVPSGSV